MIGLEKLADNSSSARNFLRIDGEWDRGPAQARVYNTAAISIPTATITALTFDSERYDTGSIHSTVTNTGRLTAPTAGLYEIGANISWTAGLGVTRFLGIGLNGVAAFIASNQYHPSLGGNATRQNVSTQYQLAAGDYVQAAVFQDTGGALNVLAASPESPEFWIVRLGSQA